MKAFWNWLSGKKTIIGAILSLLIGFAQAQEFIGGDLATLLLSLTALIVGVGVTHKVLKLKE